MQDFVLRDFMNQAPRKALPGYALGVACCVFPARVAPRRARARLLGQVAPGCSYLCGAGWCSVGIATACGVLPRRAPAPRVPALRVRPALAVVRVAPADSVPVEPVAQVVPVVQVAVAQLVHLVKVAKEKVKVADKRVKKKDAKILKTYQHRN